MNNRKARDRWYEAEDRLLMETLLRHKGFRERWKQLYPMWSGDAIEAPSPVVDVSLDPGAAQQKWGGVD